MFGWFRGRRTKETLKDRLELVLAYDRAKIAPGKVEALRNDLLEVVQRYFPSGNSRVEVEQDGDKVMLMASISIDEVTRPGAQDPEANPGKAAGKPKSRD
ncbi:cell division topological specificity factor MinE [Deinococcus reticulitermitis]|uniref:Cell division topological specificity factor n=1 Tax=Deinococcus reticulitermitis TaxID=856736 RepID=A0A1H6WE59_9DEIO|nr:cell division topological specificity factor MinE [Deinococcus reticulitermitis]SEJ15311.1 cell division topological specificity factor MinE [Deinococcus reticulitermitis]